MVLFSEIGLICLLRLQGIYLAFVRGAQLYSSSVMIMR